MYKRPNRHAHSPRETIIYCLFIFVRVGTSPSQILGWFFLSQVHATACLTHIPCCKRGLIKKNKKTALSVGVLRALNPPCSLLGLARLISFHNHIYGWYSLMILETFCWFLFLHWNADKTLPAFFFITYLFAPYDLVYKCHMFCIWNVISMFM